MGRYSRFIGIIYFTVDLLLLNLCFFFAFYLRFHVLEEQYHYSFNEDYLTQLLFSNLSWMLLVFIFKLYDIERITYLEKLVWNLIKSVFIHGLLVFALTVIIKAKSDPSRVFFLIHYVSFFIVLLFWRILFWFLLKLYRKLGYNYRRVVVVGAGPVGMQIADYFMSDASLGYHFVGFFDDNPNKIKCPGEMLIGNLTDVKYFCSRIQIDEIYCALPLSASQKIMEIKSYADNQMVRFKIVPDFRGFLNKRVDMQFYDFVPVLTIRKEPLESLKNRTMKRAFDIIFSSMVILFIFPWLLPVIAILIKMGSTGPVFFKQLRTGKDNEEFYCLKFRTMTVNKLSDELQATKNDSRITKIGNILRRTSMDELPQFFNVLLGQMSVVGPRPHMLKHTDMYRQIINKFMVRHFVKPGITGAAQIKGFRGETSDPKQMESRIRADVWYIENWSLLLDIKLVFLTVWNMLKGEDNAY
jgi:Undecaprenyl-phosphate glucose phosphotransferase